jgi:NAD(P)H-dependent FMN reductase
MAKPPRILAFSGSTRRESLNRKFLALGVEAARQAGCDVTVTELRDLAIPLYDGDLEDRDGMPAGAATLVGLIASSDGLLVASPEYNSMITPLMKNTIDWCSRPDANPFEGKVAAVISASPGMLGGVRSLQMCQQLLLKLGCIVLPGQCILPHAGTAFDEQGRLKEERSVKALQEMAKGLAALAARLSA